ncbi:MAG TPA: TadE/TadG family type IV pilus assembly protein [Microthrixaceae bacterium]|nr:TadE/TadG family type IV pilus assembly protein [Microthrixaceae bacterium]
MRQGRRDGGQATVELALVLPLLVLVVLCVVQLAMVVRDRVALSHAARVAARAAVVDPAPAAVRRAIAESTSLDPLRLRVIVHGGSHIGDTVRVVVQFRSPTDVALAGRLVGDVTMTEALSANRG